MLLGVWLTGPAPTLVTASTTSGRGGVALVTLDTSFATGTVVTTPMNTMLLVLDAVVPLLVIGIVQTAMRSVDDQAAVGGQGGLQDHFMRRVAGFNNGTLVVVGFGIARTCIRAVVGSAASSNQQTGCG